MHDKHPDVVGDGSVMMNGVPPSSLRLMCPALTRRLPGRARSASLLGICPHSAESLASTQPSLAATQPHG